MAKRRKPKLYVLDARWPQFRFRVNEVIDPQEATAVAGLPVVGSLHQVVSLETIDIGQNSFIIEAKLEQCDQLPTSQGTAGKAVL